MGKSVGQLISIAVLYNVSGYGWRIWWTIQDKLK